MIPQFLKPSRSIITVYLKSGQTVKINVKTWSTNASGDGSMIVKWSATGLKSAATFLPGQIVAWTSKSVYF